MNTSSCLTKIIAHMEERKIKIELLDSTKSRKGPAGLILSYTDVFYTN